MEREISFTDLVHIQPYLYLTKAFLDRHIPAEEFEAVFLDHRRNDSYLMSGRFNSGFDNLIRVLFNAVDDYTPPELYNPADKVDITEAQMRERVEDVVKMFEKKISRGKSSFSSME